MLLEGGWQHLQAVNSLCIVNIFEHNLLLCGCIVSVDKVLNAAADLLDGNMGHINWFMEKQSC